MIVRPDKFLMITPTSPANPHPSIPNPASFIHSYDFCTVFKWLLSMTIPVHFILAFQALLESSHTLLTPFVVKKA